MLTTKEPLVRIPFNVWRCDATVMEISVSLLIPPQTASMAQGFLFSSYDESISTGIGITYGLAPIFILGIIYSSFVIFDLSLWK
ncbi:hypothetical protein KM92DES2_20037 [uncultured Desulfovibrio sp.]|uniref:Uncharacterized protein n=1 Tax=uncultured Desulfovibrio sp. TaxID=167968 RepID=A0A212KHY3_9BACT|nr:hypothetical protein KM92DES2_20037 [uncultured Desulfovibrio sp.]